MGILGAAEARLDGAVVDLGTRKQRALLAALTLSHGSPVTPDGLVDLLWDDQPPAAVTATLQGYVAKLRRILEPDRPPRAPSQVLVLEPGGYVLAVPSEAIDAVRFETAVRSAHDRLGHGLTGEGHELGELEALFDQINEALSLWRGLPYTELEDAPAAQAERARLEELRAVALEDRAVAALGLGRHAMVAGELEVLTATYPLRERLWALRAVALTRSGRQADALEVLRQVRELLAEELGLEPGAELRDLQTAVLRQDPALAWPGPVSGSAEVASTTTPAEASTARQGRAEPTTHALRFAAPLVGRDDQLAALTGLLEQSEEAPVFAVVTGDPGIGKSRLCAELAAAAEAEGAAVLVGRCSQDQGAPPLYPWASILRQLGHELPSDTRVEGAKDSSSRFRAWEAIARTLVEESTLRHLLVVLDDLHWADASTLRVLRLLAETAETGRLMVVSTWRPEPPPTGLLAEVAEMLARRHALRIELRGLTSEEAGEILSSVADSAPTSRQAAALRERTDGNPFFLVEFARLARERGDLALLLEEDDPPAAVQDVLARRLAALPDRTARTLRMACVVGRQFDVATLAGALEVDEEDVLDDLEPALAAGLVREFGVDRFRFSHALVRDTAYATLSHSRRARMHARVAQVLADAPGRESEVARHWRSAGPQHVGKAWRAARRAAEAARHVFAHDEALALLQWALEVLEQDEEGTTADRYDLQMDLGRTLQLIGNWVDLRPLVHHAVVSAEVLGDLDRLVDAATMPVTNALWQTTRHGEVDDVIVAVLRSALDRLPPGDGPQRCRVMLSLAEEIYYGATAAEREALAEEAVAMARRLGDRRLLLWALLVAPICTWRFENADVRFELTREAADLASELGDGIAESSAMTLHTVAAGELGLVDQIEPLLADARRLADRERHVYAQLVLDAFEVPWLCLRDDFDAADERLASMLRLHERMSLSQSEDALRGAVAMRMIWAGQEEETVALIKDIEQSSSLPVETTLAAMMCRIGRVDEAREYLADREVDVTGDWWFSPLEWAMAAEAAAYVGRPDLAAIAYERLSPHCGRTACAGSGTTLGPVDAFLALAAYATGERDLATRHAENAARLCEEWEIPLCSAWFAKARARFGF